MFLYQVLVAYHFLCSIAVNFPENDKTWYYLRKQKARLRRIYFYNILNWSNDNLFVEIDQLLVNLKWLITAAMLDFLTNSIAYVTLTIQTNPTIPDFSSVKISSAIWATATVELKNITLLLRSRLKYKCLKTVIPKLAR